VSSIAYYVVSLDLIGRVVKERFCRDRAEAIELLEHLRKTDFSHEHRLEGRAAGSKTGVDALEDSDDELEFEWLT